MGTPQTPVIYKRSGRGAGRANWHLIASDGSTPLCGQRITSWDDWAVAFTTASGAAAAACPRCKKIHREDTDANLHG